MLTKLEEQQLEKQNKDHAGHIESLKKAIRHLEGRLIKSESHVRSLDALVRRANSDAQRAIQAAQQATNEVAALRNMLSRRG